MACCSWRSERFALGLSAFWAGYVHIGHDSIRHINPPTVATLVAGPTAAVLSYDDPRFSVKVEESCAISGSVAICSAEIVTGTVTSHTSQMTETVSPIEVQPWQQWSPESATTPAAPSMTSPPPAATHSNAATGALRVPCAVVFFAVLAGAASVFTW